MIYFETDYVGEEYDLVYPRILWNNVCRRGSVVVSSEADGYAGTNAATATTWDMWKPTAMPATWTLNFDTTETINAIAIDTHTLGSSGTTITIQLWDGGWQDVMTASPENDDPIAFLFEAREENSFRIALSGSSEPQIAVIHGCHAIECPQRVYMGAETPVNLAFESEFDTNQSADGHYMGRSVLRHKNRNDFTLAHVTEYWVNNTLLPFIEDAREYPYFLLERPWSHPSALSYRWRDGDIRPQRMGVTSHMQVNL